VLSAKALCDKEREKSNVSQGSRFIPEGGEPQIIATFVKAYLRRDTRGRVLATLTTAFLSLENSITGGNLIVPVTAGQNKQVLKHFSVVRVKIYS